MARRASNLLIFDQETLTIVGGVKTWFTERVDDPRITVIKVTPSEGYYWDTKHGNAVAGIKMLIGAATGKTLDDSIEGKLDV